MISMPKVQVQLDESYADYGKDSVLIIDEMGYIPLDADGGRLLFQVMSNCYERQSMIITTNIEFSKWGTVLADEKLASALVDRVKLPQFQTQFHTPYLRYGLMRAADCARKRDPYFGDHYAKAVSRGKHHYVAVSGVARKLAGVILSVMKEGRAYEPVPPSHHQPGHLRA